MAVSFLFDATIQQGHNAPATPLRTNARPFGAERWHPSTAPRREACQGRPERIGKLLQRLLDALESLPHHVDQVLVKGLRRKRHVDRAIKRQGNAAVTPVSRRQLLPAVRPKC
jgi:hypothetical protein